MYPKSFHEKLKKSREDAGYTQQQVSDILNIGRSTIANYEVGRTEPDLETLSNLADFYCVSTDWLLGTKGGKDSQNK